MMKVEKQTEKDNTSIKTCKVLKYLLSKSKKMNNQIRTLLCLFILFFTVSGISPDRDNNNVKMKEKLENSIKENMSDSTLYVLHLREKIKFELIQEVKQYIEKISPNSRINSEYLVNKCLEYNIDIIFVLSQGILESHLGTKGKAVETNSVWNVGTFDNGEVLYTYNHPDLSIEPYLKLLSERYLVDKDLHSLVQDRGYINDQGKRFATAKGYENAMRKLMVKINAESSISFYQSILKLDNDKIISFFMPPFLNNSENYIQNQLFAYV